MNKKEELKFYIKEFGGQYVIMDGTTLMLVLYVENWDIHMEMQQDKLNLDQALALYG